MKRKPDFIIPMHGEREVLEIYGWPLPPAKSAEDGAQDDNAPPASSHVSNTQGE